MIAARPRWAIAPVVALCLALNVGWIVSHLDWLRPLAAGRPAPGFTLERIDDGSRVSLASLRGKVVVVEFWATWCRPCLLALPRLDQASRRWGDRVVVLAINVDDRAKAAALFAERGYRLPLVADDGDTSQRYGVHSLPHTVVVDRDGVVRAVASRPDVAEAAVDRLLALP